MENKEIMERLLQDAKPAKAEKTEGAAVKAKNDDASISRIRVVTAKYKVYIVLLFIFIALLSLVYIPEANDSYKSSQTSYNQVKANLDNLKASIKEAQEDMSYLCDEKNGVIFNEETLKSCLNEGKECSSLPEAWKIGTGEDYDYSIPLSYLQLHSLYNKKMPVDEKRVLKNLNEYLIRKKLSSGDKERVGEILRIEIGDPEDVNNGNEHFFQVPVDVEIEFGDIGGLTGFLHNVEKKLINDSEDRILYKIQSVSYDIVTNDEPQKTDISMIAYYYHDDKFNDEKECSEELENSSNVDDEEDDDYNNSDSGSFLKKIFKK